MFSAAERAAVARLESVVRFPVYGGDCYAYGLLAMGSIDLIVEADLDVHDFMALVPVIEGAGGVVTDWQGAALTPRSDGRIVAAGDPPRARERVKVAGVNQPLNIGHRSRIGGTAPLYCHHKLGTAPGGDPTMRRFRLPFGLALTLALVAPSWVERPGGGTRPRRGDARRSQVWPRLRALRLRQSERAQGRHGHLFGGRQLRQLQSLHHQGQTRPSASRCFTRA